MIRDGNILEIENLCVNLMTVRGIIYAVQGISLQVRAGEIHGIVGESGCGKSVSTKAIMRLHDEERTEYTGSIRFASADGEKDLLTLSEKQITAVRGSEISMIFQDPMTALNPIMRAGEQVAEQLRAKKGLNRKESRAVALQLFEKVGILPAEKRYDQYPFEMSGGMLQRIMIAMALSCQPRLLLADEPTTALDVTIQAQILELIRELQQESGTSVIFITHDLGVIAEICDTVSVMYAGKVVETGTVLEIFDEAQHPYTRALLDSNPKEADRGEYMKSISGAPPLLYETFTGCPFVPRCPYATPQCSAALPGVTALSDTHTVSCFHLKEEGAGYV